MRLRRETIGRTAGSRWQPATAVEAYTLATDDGFGITVWTYGATLVEVLVPDRAGVPGNVVLRLGELAQYEDRALNAYLGCTMGRYCRCVADGRLTLDGVTHQLDRNDGRHHLHGGPDGFDRRVWTAEAGRDGDDLVVRMRLISPDGDQGYPGELTGWTVYRLSPERRLTIDFGATTTASTVVGFTNHAFWNLAAGGTIDRQVLRLNSSRSVMFDDEAIPVAGPPRDITGSPLDFRRPRPIAGQRIDNFFVLDGPDWAAELADEASGRSMRVFTDQSGLGVYSADGYPGRRRAGLCLQTSAWPDAPNRPDFPSARLDPGGTYRHRVGYEFRTAG
ncbi:galactose mutarotase [Solwaraspora sp. WMMD1047]|uniref:aldose epimerase family protein n=1 Tax=Solwaraspora sp. WMMD1047 TaxID=3016102 RepID=UPI002416B6EF|nr:aldose epimerase family protein [Solwaraspora sp. WMMD1047]MDG4829598.1 galactose mutarotase [Solwaraspora sp. WMMD1047]